MTEGHGLPMFGEAFPAEMATADGASAPIAPTDTQRPESQLMSVYADRLNSRPPWYGALGPLSCGEEAMSGNGTETVNTEVSENYYRTQVPEIFGPQVCPPDDNHRRTRVKVSRAIR